MQWFLNIIIIHLCKKCSKGIRFIFIYLALASVGTKQRNHINKTPLSLMLESVRDLEIVLSYCTMDMNKTG